MTMGSPRVFDGHAYVDVHQDHEGSSPDPMPDGDGSIFVSIASYRGKTSGGPQIDPAEAKRVGTRIQQALHDLSLSL